MTSEANNAFLLVPLGCTDARWLLLVKTEPSAKEREPLDTTWTVVARCGQRPLHSGRARVGAANHNHHAQEESGQGQFHLASGRPERAGRFDCQRLALVADNFLERSATTALL